MKNLLITGDSLSYNRYGYDDTPRVNATDCFAGMNSWSFRLCRKFISSALGFKYGCELDFKEDTVLGPGNDVDDVNAYFGIKVVTVTPENGLVHFTAESETGKIVLYLQCRRNNYCRFNIYVNGVLTKESVDTYGEIPNFQGYGLKIVEIDCNKEKKIHEIIFSDFEYTEQTPCVTIAGISTEARGAYTTGQGGRTAKFMLYHFEERIEKYSPDILLLTLGANDITYYSEEEYGEYLNKLFTRIREQFADCRIYALAVHESSKLSDEIRGIAITSDEDLNCMIEKYNEVLEKISSEFGVVCIDTKRIFKGVSPKLWRYDNIHFSNKGNDMLYDEVCKILRF